MKIPNTNICCTFYYQQFKIKQHKRTMVGMFQTDEGEIPYRNRITCSTYAKSIDDVPYWRLYIVKKERVKTKYGVVIRRNVVFKTQLNFDFQNVCDLISRLGNLKNNYGHTKGVSYCYECWPRRTMFNRTYDNYS